MWISAALMIYKIHQSSLQYRNIYPGIKFSHFAKPTLQNFKFCFAKQWYNVNLHIWRRKKKKKTFPNMNNSIYIQVCGVLWCNLPLLSLLTMCLFSPSKWGNNLLAYFYSIFKWRHYLWFNCLYKSNHELFQYIFAHLKSLWFSQ